MWIKFAYIVNKKENIVQRKKTDSGKISNYDLIEKLILLNSKQRKCLNWEISKNHILIYFLGNIFDGLRNLIQRFLIDKNLKIINFLDKNNNERSL